MIVTTCRKLRLLERVDITRCLCGARLECGCLVGWYDTFSGTVLTIVDVAATTCRDRSHLPDFVIQEHRRDASDAGPGESAGARVGGPP